MESLQQLESSKNELHTAIGAGIASKSQQSIDSTNVVNTLQLLDAMNQEIQSNILAWSNGSSVDLKNINNQRKTPQTYGGVAPGEVVSYYIDFKNNFFVIY